MLSFAVRANPNCVLSAAATASWPPALPVEALFIQVSLPDGGDASVTPTWEPSDGGLPLLPVLMLEASTTYSMVAVAQLSDGGQAVSAPATLTTDALPPGVPHFNVAVGGTPTAGYTLVGNEPNVYFSGQYYAVAVDGAGKVVWYLTLPKNHALVGDFQKQPDGSYTVAVFDSSVVMPNYDLRLATYIQYDSLGNTINTWRSPDATATNEHEFRLLPDGTGVLMGYVYDFMDLGLYRDGGEPDASMVESRVERLYPDGGVATFSWDQDQHVPLGEMSPLYPANVFPLDPYHANAVDLTADGNYLVEDFNMNHIVKVDAQTGQVVWTLGGSDGDFTIVGDPLGSFSLIHGGRQLPNGDIIAFDNGWGHHPQVSRAVEYSLDLSSMTATLVWQSARKAPLFAYRFGFAQRLDNGNTLVTYGADGVVDEVQPDGGVAWELTDTQKTALTDGGSTPTDIGIYRAFRVDTLY